MRKKLLIALVVAVLGSFAAWCQDDGSSDYERGLQYFKTNDWKPALNAFLDAIDRKGDVPEYHYYAGLSWMQLMIFDKADEELRWAMHFCKPDNPTYMWAWKYYTYIQQKDSKIVPGQKAGYLYLGINPAWMWLRMERPEIYDNIKLHERYGAKKAGKLYKFEQFFCHVTGLDDKVIEIKSWNPAFTIDGGLKKGSPSSEVIARYGTPTRLEGIEDISTLKDASQATLFYDKSGIGFLIRDGKIARFIIYEPGDYSTKKSP